MTTQSTNTESTSTNRSVIDELVRLEQYIDMLNVLEKDIYNGSFPYRDLTQTEQNVVIHTPHDLRDEWLYELQEPARKHLLSQVEIAGGHPYCRRQFYIDRVVSYTAAETAQEYDELETIGKSLKQGLRPLFEKEKYTIRNASLSVIDSFWDCLSKDERAHALKETYK